MKARCLNPRTRNFNNYGGRGIRVCEEWRDSFESFLRDMGTKPSPRHSLERNNNDGNYEPTNCRWATFIEQSRNKRTNRKLTYNGETLTVSQWAERFGLQHGTILKRLDRGWSDSQAVSTPLIPRGVRGLAPPIGERSYNIRVEITGGAIENRNTNP